MKKLSFTFAFILILATVYSQEEINYAIMPSKFGQKTISQCSRWYPEKVDSFFEITSKEATLLVSKFSEIKNTKSKLCCNERAKITNINQYGYQFIGVVISGKKYIYINAFDMEFVTQIKRDWKKEPFTVCDGGSYYWGVLFDLKTTKFSKLAFNGEI